MQQTCKACGRPDKFDFHVPDEVWEAVAGAEYMNKVVCLGCFDAMAHQKGVDYARSLESLFFAGERASFVFGVLTSTSASEYYIRAGGNLEAASGAL